MQSPLPAPRGEGGAKRRVRGACFPYTRCNENRLSITTSMETPIHGHFFRIGAASKGPRPSARADGLSAHRRRYGRRELLLLPSEKDRVLHGPRRPADRARSRPGRTLREDRRRHPEECRATERRRTEDAV